MICFLFGCGARCCYFAALGFAAEAFFSSAASSSSSVVALLSLGGGGLTTAADGEAGEGGLGDVHFALFDETSSQAKAKGSVRLSPGSTTAPSIITRRVTSTSLLVGCLIIGVSRGATVAR